MVLLVVTFIIMLWKINQLSQQDSFLISSLSFYEMLKILSLKVTV